MKLDGSALGDLLRESTPFGMRIVGRTLLHAAARRSRGRLGGRALLRLARVLQGIVSAASLRVATAELEYARRGLAADLMQPPLSVAPEDDLRTAAERMLARGIRALLVLGKDGVLLCLVGESELTGLYLKRAADAEREASSLRTRG